eukprot:6195975-Pleurochrysis_carterae.AAC.1
MLIVVSREPCGIGLYALFERLTPVLLLGCAYVRERALREASLHLTALACVCDERKRTAVDM